MNNRNDSQNAHLASKIRKKEDIMPPILYNDFDEEDRKTIDNEEEIQNVNDFENDDVVEPEDKNEKDNKKGFFNNLINGKVKNSGNILDITISKSLRIKLIIGAGVLLVFFLILLAALSPSFGGILDLTENSEINFPSKEEPGSISGNFNAGAGGNVLTGGLKSIIGDEAFNKLNQSVSEAIQSTGFCTKAASAAAAAALISGLQEHGFRVPYYWGGGHGQHVIGVDPDLGAPVGESCSDTNCYYNKGYDCSGFVSWAVTNATNRQVSMITNGFMGVSTPISFGEASAGDILVNEGHIVLVIQNNGSTLLTAESAGNGIGVIFGSYEQARIGAARLQIKSMSSYFDSVC